MARHNADPAPRFSGLVRPSDAEADLNGYALSRRRRRQDWEVKAEAAIQAFERNGFFVFIGDRQVDHLDEELALAPHELRGGQLVAQLDAPVLAGGSFREELLRSRDWIERVVAQPPETVGSVLMLLVRRGSGSGGSWWLRQQAGELARRRHAVSAEDALLAARTVLRASDDWYAGGLLRPSKACCAARSGRSPATRRPPT